MAAPAGGRPPDEPVGGRGSSTAGAARAGNRPQPAVSHPRPTGLCCASSPAGRASRAAAHPCRNRRPRHQAAAAAGAPSAAGPWPGLAHAILARHGDSRHVPCGAGPRRATACCWRTGHIGASHLPLAHHADDAAEMGAVRLLRGSGIDGPAGMPALPRAQTGWPGAAGPAQTRPVATARPWARLFPRCTERGRALPGPRLRRIMPGSPARARPRGAAAPGARAERAGVALTMRRRQRRGPRPPPRRLPRPTWPGRQHARRGRPAPARAEIGPSAVAQRRGSTGWKRWNASAGPLPGARRARRPGCHDRDARMSRKSQGLREERADAPMTRP
jgi:hypothetical protein